MNVRPRRRTTIDPSLSFNAFNEFLTFIVASFLLTQERPSTTCYSGEHG
jgi:hypothetical protein